jgi:hypothetical protein
MTIEDYWDHELQKANELAPSNDGFRIVAALIVARQLRDIVTHLNQIEAQLSLIQQAIEQ